MAHGDFLIFINVICWVFFFFFSYYFIFSISLLPNLFNNIRIRTFLSRIHKSIVFSTISFVKLFGVVYSTVSMFSFTNTLTNWVTIIFFSNSFSFLDLSGNNTATLSKYICLFI